MPIITYNKGWGSLKKIILRQVFVIVSISGIAYFILLQVLIHFEEAHPEANIKNLFDAVWWSLVTITTIGYGDTYPVTTGGRMIGFVFFIISLSVYSILIGRITNLIATILENKKMGFYGMKHTGHAVIIGWGPFGRMVTDELVAAGRKVAVVTRVKNNIDLIREAYSTSQVFTLYSDLTNIETLQKVNVKDAAIVFINLDNDTEKLVFILNIKKHYPNLKYIVTIDNSDLKDTFLSAGVTYAISKTSLASKLLASYIFEPDVASYNEEIISYAESDEDYDMKQFQILKNNPYLNQFYTKVFYDLKKECNAILVGIVKNKENRKLLKNPEGDVKIDVGDYLIMIANGKTEKKIARLFGTKEGFTE